MNSLSNNQGLSFLKSWLNSPRTLAWGIVMVLTLALTPILMAQGHDHSRPGMGHDHGSNPSPTTPPTSDNQSSSLYSGSGTIKAIKVEGEKLIVTLAHSPIPALNWPSMVMDFEVESRDLLAGLTVGDKTNFDFKASGKTYIITDLEKQQ